MKLNFGDAFRFPFKDKNWWLKILIGIVPIANLGYILRILQDAKEGKEATLPEWTEWEKLFKSGVMALVICLCYVIPIVILKFLGVAPLVGILFKVLALAAGILVMPVIAIALCRYLENNQINDAFNFQAIYEKFKINVKEYLIVAVVFAIIHAVLGVIAFASIFTICLFPLIFLLLFYVSFYLSIIANRLYGEIYRGEVAKE